MTLSQCSKALDARYVAYIVIGGFARVIHGTDELTRGLDIVPSTRPENIRQLGDALAATSRHDVKTAGSSDSTRAPPGQPLLALTTDAGELKIVREPAGTRGYDDLRRAATRKPLGQGVRPSVASTGDLARMLGALGRDQDLENLRMLRRLIELDRDLHRGRYIERWNPPASFAPASDSKAAVHFTAITGETQMHHSMLG